MIWSIIISLIIGFITGNYTMWKLIFIGLSEKCKNFPDFFEEMKKTIYGKYKTKTNKKSD